MDCRFKCKKIYKTISTEYEKEFHLILSKNVHKKMQNSSKGNRFLSKKKISKWMNSIKPYRFRQQNLYGKEESKMKPGKSSVRAFILRIHS